MRLLMPKGISLGSLDPTDTYLVLYTWNTVAVRTSSPITLRTSVESGQLALPIEDSC